MIGREHAKLMREHAGVEFAALADPAPAGREMAAQYGCRFFEDYRVLLDEVKPDGVIVAMPNQLHAEAALACIDRKIPSLVEKPLADTIENALRITEASETSGVPVLVGHHRRHSPDIREARRVVASGELGDLVAVNGMCLFDKPDAYFAADWRRKAGGGPLLINLIHDIDSLRFICGEIESVRAFTSDATRGFEVEDTASVAIRFTSGVLGTFMISDAVASPWSWEFTSQQALYFPAQPGAYLFLGGRKASLSVSDLYLWRHTDPAGNWQTPLQREHRPHDNSRAYVNQLDHFLQVIAGEAEPLISARDGMMTLAATLGVGIAASEDRTVRVSELV
jgi:predicted dehydrogenase